MEIELKCATIQDLDAVVNLALKLWPHHKKNEFEEEFNEFLNDSNASIHLAYKGEVAIGFAQCQLRFDYVEGTSGNPVGYLEGIYIDEEYRRKGIGRRLVKACELWSKSKGCFEFASDCQLDNSESYNFHVKIGFTEANRIICFIKKL